MPSVGVFAAIFDADRRILCVRQGTGARRWTLPGGRMEVGESLEEALVREVLEETGLEVSVGALIGLYSTPAKDALAISFRAEVIGSTPWRPTAEIAEIGYFAHDALPTPMRSLTRARVDDAFAGASGVVRTASERKVVAGKLVRVS